jgi:hypothetical protein
MTGRASTLACGQNNQGYGEITVAATGPTEITEPTTVLALTQARQVVEPGAPGVNLTVGGVHTDDPATDILDPGEVAHVKVDQQVQAAAYVNSAGESPYQQTVLVYDGAPDTGELVAVTTLQGATAVADTPVPFTWRPKLAGEHTLYVKLLGHIAAGEDDLLTIPVQVDAVEPPPTTPPTTPPATTEPTTTAPTSTDPTSTATTASYQPPPTYPQQYSDKATGELSYTGAGPLPALMAIGLGLLALGVSMIVGSRRRRGTRAR